MITVETVGDTCRHEYKQIDRGRVVKGGNRKALHKCVKCGNTREFITYAVPTHSIKRLDVVQFG